MHYVLGIGRFRLDGIIHVIDDAGGHGLHVIGYKIGSTRYSRTPPHFLSHIFIRLADGRRFRRSLDTIGNDRSFLADPNRRAILDQSTAALSRRTGLALCLPIGEPVVQDLGKGSPARLDILGRVFIVQKLEDGHVFDCRNSAEQTAPSWRVTI